MALAIATVWLAQSWANSEALDGVNPHVYARQPSKLTASLSGQPVAIEPARAASAGLQ